MQEKKKLNKQIQKNSSILAPLQRLKSYGRFFV